MENTTTGWLNFASLIIFSAIFAVLYVMSVRPAHLEQKIGEKAYHRCARIRLITMIPMGIVAINYVLYLFYPVSFDPFPARFSWPYGVNIVLALILGIPTLIVFIRGNIDAGKETLIPEKDHKLYGGIYKKIRHPQALGEAPMFIWISLLMNSPFMTVFSLVYLPIWYWWSVEEEKDLLLRYGDAYAEYKQRTGMFFPKRQKTKETQTSRSQKLLRVVAVILTIYTLIEVTDCLTILLMHFGLLANPYPALAFREFDTLLKNQPLTFFPVFLYFTSLRMVSAFGLFRQRMWAFWTTVLVCVTTILWVPFLMPFAGSELLLDGAILFLLLLARFGNQPILSAT